MAAVARSLRGLFALVVAGVLLMLPGIPGAAAEPDRQVVTRGAQWFVAGGPTFTYGRSADVQVMGDWNDDGVRTPGVFRAGTWYLRNTLSSGAADLVVAFGRAGDRPVVGDWDGDGRTGIGVVRGSTWFLRGTPTSGVAEVTFAFGRRGDTAVTGNWDGVGGAGIGVVRAGVWYLREAPGSGLANTSFVYGARGDVPVTGDWDDDGRTGIGVVRGATWYLRNVPGPGAASSVATYGRCGDGVLSTHSARTEPGVPPSLRGTEWSVLPTTERVVALTFDAGANADAVPSILATLRATGTPATFFLTGAWTQSFPGLAADIAGAYPVGNHTQSHPDLTTLSDADVRSQVIAADSAIREGAGTDPRPWFRFPFGARDARTISLVNCLGYGSVRWTVDTLGWQGTSGGQSASAIVSRVLANLRPGEIVLLHVGSHPTDGSTLDADALPAIIREVEARGYRFVDLDDYR
ncbi:polysaccharide deacetylase family protein [Georgenia muralis]|uniref:Peptidoglycan/xylan/chitin deacetylase (PgdA/CDA1 family) n=1 Tax=Georgenia muralis TaxID=154117 RepID=A0A3N5A1Z4_9MICO|nr:polysaccharide deacetylase family protein [Georgenia muralis]RPF25901.1 peptidoglycan/xylan/chitin deacetylase (PgdA/CDA1 family) [Georgenia muralis]